MTKYYSKALVSSITKTENELKITLKAIEGYSREKDVLWANKKNTDTCKVLNDKDKDITAKAEFEVLLLHAYSDQTPVELCLNEGYEVISVTLA